MPCYRRIPVSAGGSAVSFAPKPRPKPKPQEKDPFAMDDSAESDDATADAATSRAAPAAAAAALSAAAPAAGRPRIRHTFGSGGKKPLLTLAASASASSRAAGLAPASDRSQPGKAPQQGRHPVQHCSQPGQAPARAVDAVDATDDGDGNDRASDADANNAEEDVPVYDDLDIGFWPFSTQFSALYHTALAVVHALLGAYAYRMLNAA